LEKIMDDHTFVPSVMRTKASKCLEDAVAKELELPDPTPAQAKAALEEHTDESANTDDAGGED
jgi:hypothetical protein